MDNKKAFFAVVVVLIAFASPAIVMFGIAGGSTLMTVGCIGVETIQNPLFGENSANPNSESNRYSYYGTRFHQTIEKHIVGSFDQEGCSVIWGADHETFKVLNESWAKDKNKAYYNNHRGKVVSFKVDGDTFELIDNASYDKRVVKDKNNVYCVDDIVENADTNTFQSLGSNYFKDKNNVYYDICSINGIIIESADAQSFEVLKNDYAKDKDNVYYKTNIVSNADAGTFQVSDPFFKIIDGDEVHIVAYDKNRLFYNKEGFSVRSVDREISEYEKYQEILQGEVASGDTAHTRSKKFSQISTIKKAVEVALQYTKECDESENVIKGTENGMGFICPGYSPMSWPFLGGDSCGKVQSDTEWIVAYKDGEWSYTLECKNYPECSGIENLQCTKDGCVFSEKCN